MAKIVMVRMTMKWQRQSGGSSNRIQLFHATTRAPFMQRFDSLTGDPFTPKLLAMPEKKPPPSPPPPAPCCSSSSASRRCSRALSPTSTRNAETLSMRATTHEPSFFAPPLTVRLLR